METASLNELKNKYGVFSYAQGAQRMFNDIVYQQNNYEAFTTFFSDFSIAEYSRYTEEAITDTYKRCVKSWCYDYKYLAELILSLNHKSWFWWQHKEYDLSSVYSQLYLDCKSEYMRTYGEDAEAMRYYYDWID